jgi:hypothetical protein
MSAAVSDGRAFRALHERFKGGMSLRGIVEETSLGFQTVRTIVAQGEQRDRTTQKHRGRLERIAVDRTAEVRWRARKRTRDGLPKRINESLTKGRDLVKAAKGLDGFEPWRHRHPNSTIGRR